jgi:hypothetical protein
MKMGALLAVLLVCAGASGVAHAHRLDEYLQATRISVDFNRIGAEISLTPGAAVADGVFSAIDLDHDGEVSPTEGFAYAKYVVDSLSLEIDERPHALSLDSYSIPSLVEMRLGQGIIRLRATAKIPPASPGLHRLAFANTHRSDIGVYLINALIPADEGIRITRQSRDVLQHEFTMDYSVSPAANSSEMATVLPPILGLSLAAAVCLLVSRWKGEISR